MMEIEKAKRIGKYFIEALAPFCVEDNGIPLCIIAGSVRRKCDEVGDLEVVAKPYQKAPRPNFGDKIVYASMLEKVFHEELVAPGWLIRKVLDGPKQKKYEINMYKFGIQASKTFYLDLFLDTPPTQWGVLMLIRTGPKQFSKWMVTKKMDDGALPDDCYVEHNVIMREGIALVTPTEYEFFELCGLKYLEPEKRVPRWKAF
jgi:DNA polymerase/3'-5' exonuclease PolX